ncbi:MAG TPA: sigma-70 family RNA polymerase sigma factor, partial [Acidimicrobiales bacterium]|nr:sigma-70 family RNA polymerase sigma factor [Acidimicrobiales bacterium]
ETDLVAAAKAGDSAGFGELVRRSAPRLLSVAGQLVGPTAAEDVVQEAMLNAWRALPSFAGRSSFDTWLYRITVNVALRQRRRHQPVVVEAEPLALLERWADPEYRVDPELVAVRRSQAETLRAVLDQLPEAYRLALVLHDGEGLSAAELAEVTGIPLGTAKSNIRRGRMALVSLLGDRETEAEER